MSGVLHIVGVGPGDPELVTVKAARILGAATTIAFFAKRGRPGHARTIASPHLNPAALELRFEYPFTTEHAAGSHAYVTALSGFYDEAAGSLSTRLAAGQDVALLCEGDPFLYGSAIHLFDRLADRHRVEIVPGVTSASGAWTAAAVPFARGDALVTILPGTRDEEALLADLRRSDAAVIVKLGRNLPRVRRAIAKAGLTERALYVEYATMTDQRIVPLSTLATDEAPYFSLILIPGLRQR